MASLLGRRIETVYETIEHAPGRVAAWKTVSGPLPLTFRRTFEAKDGGTRVTIVYEAEVGGLKRLLLKALAGSARRSLDKDILALRKLLDVRAQA